jgi:hypothetical protein
MYLRKAKYMVMKNRKTSTKIVNFIILRSLPPWGLGKNFPKLTNFQKSSSLQPHMWRKN